jgi:hypothetical protein
MDLHLHTSLFCTKFADDSNFLGSGRTRDEAATVVNQELIKISKWFSDNRLTLHPNKSRFLVHSRDKLIELFLNGSKIMRCGYGLQEESVKFLGLHIDENLDWAVHINNVIKKISKGSYLLWRHKNLGIKTKLLLYECFIRCHILYCLTVWGGAKLNTLVATLKKTWRHIGKYKQHTIPRLKEHSILQLTDEVKLQESKFLWRWEKNKTPDSLKQIIVEKVDNLRGRRFVIPRGAKPNSIVSRLSRRAESLIPTITLDKTKKSMSKQMKTATINTYSFMCRRRDCFICSVRP